MEGRQLRNNEKGSIWFGEALNMDGQQVTTAALVALSFIYHK